MSTRRLFKQERFSPGSSFDEDILAMWYQENGLVTEEGSDTDLIRELYQMESQKA